MQKLISCFSVYFLFLVQAFSQNPLVKQWDHRFGGDSIDALTDFHQTSDEGYILGGYSYSGIGGDKTQANWDTLGNTYDYWIVKISSFGNKQWDEDFGGSSDDALSSLRQTADGGYILGGYSLSGISGNKTLANWDTSGNTYDYWIVKIDSLGTKLWDKDFGGTNDDILTTIQQTNDGGYILGGYSLSGISGDKTQSVWGGTDFWIVKTDSLGNKQWDKDFGGTYDDYLFSLQQTSDAGYILGGVSYSGIGGNKTQSNRGYSDYWILKTDSLGNKQWDKRYGGINYDEFHSLQQTADGGYILGGYSNSGINGDKTQALWGWSDYWIIKTDSTGIKQWDKDFGGTNPEEDFGNISQTADMGYLIAGTSYSYISGNKSENNLGQEQSWVLKTDSSGIIEWDKTLLTNAPNINDDETGFAIQTKDECYVMANFTFAGIGGNKTQSSQGLSDYWIIKFCDTTQTTSIHTIDHSNFDIQISPNPFNEELAISSLQSANKTMEIKIYDVYGKEILSTPLIFANCLLLTANFSPGIYFLKAIFNGQHVVKKIVKE